MSSSAKELAHFERIRNQFEKQDVSTSKPIVATAKPRIQPPAPKVPIRQHSNPNQPMAPVAPSTHLTVRPKPDGRKHSMNKGKGKGKGIANPDSGPESGEEEDDEYVIKTGQLNGHVNGSKGKDQEKVVDGFVDEGDEDLYS